MSDESRDGRTSAAAEAHEINAFELFCCYHLGVQEDGTYRFGNVHDAGKRFGCGPAVVRQALEDLGLRNDDLWDLDFDLPDAQIDIALAEAGSDLRRLALRHWRLLLDAPVKKRNWEQELRADEAVNAATYERGSKS
jgi:hypothetical protein